MTCAWTLMRADLVPVGPAIHHGPTADQGPGKGRWPQHFLYFRARVARSAVWPEAAATAESTSRPSASWDEPASVFTRRVERPTLVADINPTGTSLPGYNYYVRRHRSALGCCHHHAMPNMQASMPNYLHPRHAGTTSGLQQQVALPSN
jgi:hypothetical protein